MYERFILCIPNSRVGEADGSYHLSFKRKYGSFYSTNRTVFIKDKTIFAPDVHILLGSMKRTDPTVADLGHLEGAYIQYLSLSDVLKEYRKASKVRSSKMIAELDIEESQEEIVFKVWF